MGALNYMIMTSASEVVSVTSTNQQLGTPFYSVTNISCGNEAPNVGDAWVVVWTNKHIYYSADWGETLEARRLDEWYYALRAMRYSRGEVTWIKSQATNVWQWSGTSQVSWAACKADAAANPPLTSVSENGVPRSFVWGWHVPGTPSTWFCIVQVQGSFPVTSAAPTNYARQVDFYFKGADWVPIGATYTEYDDNGNGVSNGFYQYHQQVVAGTEPVVTGATEVGSVTFPTAMLNRLMEPTNTTTLRGWTIDDDKHLRRWTGFNYY
jgi:hypothetical protein